jgi:competence protein ComEC
MPLLFFLILLFIVFRIFAPSKKAKRTHNQTKKSKGGCFGVVAVCFILFIAAGSNVSDSNTQDTKESHPTNVVSTATVIPTKQPTKVPTATPTASPTASPSQSPVKQSSYLEVHFLDVGQADAALVLCDGQAMLVDGGNSSDSSFIYAYLKEHNVSHLDYIVATHGHADHVGGLAGALNYATAEKALCSALYYDSEEFGDFIKYLGKRNATITIPEVGEVFTLGSATFEIVGPLSDSDNHNDTSLVLRLIFGDTSFLFTGDAETEEEFEIIASGRDIRSTVLKVGHHGSGSSTTPAFLKKVSPEYAVISVGYDNAYGFPAQDTIETLRNANVKVFRTDMQGTIVCRSDGSKLTFSVERNADAETLPTPSPVPTNTPVATQKPVEEKHTTEYVLNKNTKKFHYTDCKSVKQMKEKNKIFFTGTRDEVIRKGYKPCGNCHP